MFKNNNKSGDNINRALCVAPMMDWTDRHCRFFHRLLAPQALLFTEMVSADAILHAGPERFCQHHKAEHPVALQLGGSDPAKLARAIRAASAYDFDEFNLNVGCPSPRVRAGRFGACLMAEPELVAECVQAMQEETDKEVSIKCRIGIDDMDPVSGLDHFVETQISAGIKVIYLHSRKAWLNGLSPKENREIPPLDYRRAEQLASDFPEIDVILNGGIASLDLFASPSSAPDTDSPDLTSERFAGVMIGRAAYKTPQSLAELSHIIFGTPVPDRLQIAEKMTAYAHQQIETGTDLHQITRHMLGLFNAEKGARYWRRNLGELARMQPQNAALILETAQACLEKESASLAEKKHDKKLRNRKVA